MTWDSSLKIHPMLHRKAFSYANQQSEWIAHRMLIIIGTYWAIYDWLAQLGHTLPHPILANWLILSASCRCSSFSGPMLTGWVRKKVNQRWKIYSNLYWVVARHCTADIRWIWCRMFGLPFFGGCQLTASAAKMKATTQDWTWVTVVQTQALTTVPRDYIYFINQLLHIGSST